MLNLATITSQVDVLVQTIAETTQLHHTLVQQCISAAGQCGDSSHHWREATQTAMKAFRSRFNGAIPMEYRPVIYGIPAPSSIPDVTTIAIDGSQVVPDSHRTPIPYGLTQVGGIVIQYGSKLAPQTTTEAAIYYPTTEMPYLTPGDIYTWRDLGEIALLAKLAQMYPPTPQLPTVALLDQRLMYVPYGNRPDAHVITTSWINTMAQIQGIGGTILAGYIDQPQRGSVANTLLQMAYESGRAPLDVVNDAELFDFLGPGERSVLFANVSDLANAFKGQGQPVWFFYFRPPGSKTIARVDIPAWVHDIPGAIDTLHSTLCRECQTLNGGYPYALARADEIAVVRTEDVTALDTLISLRLEKGRTGTITTALSNKAASKALLRQYS